MHQFEPRDGQSILSLLADDLRQRSDEWTAAILSRISAEIPHLIGDAQGYAAATASTGAVLADFAAALTSGESTYHAPQAALGFARHLARREVPVADMLRSYRLGQELLFERATALSEGSAAHSMDAMELGLVTFRFIDDVTRDVVAAFDRERTMKLGGILAKRERMVESLLAGAYPELGVIERTLGRRMRGSHLAIVGWRTDGTADPEGIYAAMRPLVAALTTDSPLLVYGSSGEVCAWASPHANARHTPCESAADIERLVSAGVRVAIGTTGTGPAGFVASRKQADIARALALQIPRSPVTRYNDVSLKALLLRDRDAAETFARDELGALAEDVRSLAAVRGTVRTYLECHQDGSETARQLGIHRNTVSRRLQRAELLIGHPLTQRSVEVAVALTILDV